MNKAHIKNGETKMMFQGVSIDNNDTTMMQSQHKIQHTLLHHILCHTILIFFTRKLHCNAML
jgi:hypothetical protein